MNRRGNVLSFDCAICAAASPWKDLTAATLAELRFNSIAGWLPIDDATTFRVSFQREMNRLYATAEAHQGCNKVA